MLTGNLKSVGKVYLNACESVDTLQKDDSSASAPNALTEAAETAVNASWIPCAGIRLIC
jgi:hypothetical protein